MSEKHSLKEGKDKELAVEQPKNRLLFFRHKFKKF